jgi:hypothetical protein
VIIDCHGHYTTAPPQLGQYRDAQKAALRDDPGHVGDNGTVDISDDELRDSLERNQLRLQRERGLDLTLFSPRASWMEHHVGNEHTSRFWSEQCNNLIRRICDLYPENFSPVCQLPQSPCGSTRPFASCGGVSRRWDSSVQPQPRSVGRLLNSPALADRNLALYEALPSSTCRR